MESEKSAKPVMDVVAPLPTRPVPAPPQTEADAKAGQPVPAPNDEASTDVPAPKPRPRHAAPVGTVVVTLLTAAGLAVLAVFVYLKSR